VFVVGCGRSGTTLLYELMSEHPDTSWISNYADIHPIGAVLTRRPLRSVISVATKRLRRRAEVRPVEGYRSWDRAVGLDREQVLDASDLGEEQALLVAMVRRNKLLAGGGLFLNKNTRNTRRVGYLAAAFPRARWLHIVRDPRAVALSLDKVAFWNSSPAWWRGNRTVGEEVREGADSFELAAECWAAEVGAADDALAGLDPALCHVLRYEDLVADPDAALRPVAAFTGLSPGPLLDSAKRRPINDRTAVALAQLSSAQTLLVRRNCSELALRYGYEL